MSAVVNVYFFRFVSFHERVHLLTNTLNGMTTVGTSMQDFSKEEYNFLNSGCDKDATLVVTNESPLERIKLAKTPDLIEAPESIKLEDPSIFAWHSTTADIGSNLL